MKTAILSAIALLACVHRLTAAPATARALPGLMPAPEFVLQHESEIGLSAEQRAKLEASVSELSGAAQRAEGCAHRQVHAALPGRFALAGTSAAWRLADCGDGLNGAWLGCRLVWTCSSRLRRSARRFGCVRALLVRSR